MLKFIKRTKVVFVCIMVIGIMGNVVNAGNYTVKSGDVLWKIAKDNEATVEEIVKDNNLSNPNLIYVGQVLSVNERVDGLEVVEETTNVSRTSLDNPLTAPTPEGFRVTIIGSVLPVLSLTAKT